MNKTFLYDIIGAEPDIVLNYVNKTLTVREIAIKWKVTERQIYNIIKKHNVTRGPSKLKQKTA